MKKIFNKPFLLIELKEGSLILTLAKKIIFSKRLLIINVSNINLEQTTYYNGKIFNQSTICGHIKDFISKYNLQKPQTIINLPELSVKPEYMKTLTTFQTALCISKAMVCIKKIIATEYFNKSNEKLDSVQSQNLLEKIGASKLRSPKPWLTVSAACILLCSFFYKDILQTQNAQITQLKNQTNQLQAQSDQLNLQIKGFAQIKAENEKLNKICSYIAKSKKHTQNPFKHLEQISSKIQTNTYLTNLIFDKNVDSSIKRKDAPVSPKFSTIQLEGFSESIQSANGFIKNLAKNKKLFNQIDLLHIQKTRMLSKEKCSYKTIPNLIHPKYHFKASGRFNYIC